VYFFFPNTINPFQVFSMVTIYFIWIIQFPIQLKRKRYPIQSKSKKLQISWRFGLKNSDPVHHWFTLLLLLRNHQPTKERVETATFSIIATEIPHSTRSILLSLLRIQRGFVHQRLRDFVKISLLESQSFSK